MDDFDVVIVGARCAGSTLATLLARRGLRVCLLDRAAFPSETPSTHVIQPNGVAILARLGVLERLDARGAARIDRLTMVHGAARIDAGPAADPFPGMCVRRVTLDAVLVDAARAAGVDVRTNCAVSEVIRDGHRVVGVHTPNGAVRAGLVVGADGRRSTVAAAVQAREYHRTPQGRVPVWGYFSGVADREGRLRLGLFGESALLACPTDAELYMACVAVPEAQREQFLADRTTNFTTGLRQWPELADVLRDAKPEGPLRVMARWHGYFRTATGPGWVLVGDAGHFKDFTPAQGISDAFRQAQTLADAIATHAGDPDSTAAALRRWWSWRDRDSYEMHWLATDMGDPRSSSALTERILRDIGDDPAAADKLLDVLDHRLAPSRLFTPTRLARSALHALRDEPTKIPATAREIAHAIGSEIRRKTHARMMSVR